MLVHATDRIRSLFLEESGARPIVLLGAGASKKSGIPLSNEIVEIAAKWTYCQAHGRHPEDPDVKRSDWLGWLQGHAWYRSDLSQAENYSSVIQNVLQPRENRKEFFLRLITPNVPASTGYHRLLDLMGERRIETVLTTNFDRVLPDLQVMRRRPHHLEVIRTPADYTKLSTSPTHPQLVYLHGSVEHYSDKNLPDEVQHLDPTLVSLLLPLLRDHPLLVIGYRGAEPSITQHLLADQCRLTNQFRQGIYWCVRPSTTLHAGVSALANRLSGNLQLVQVAGFDEVMEVIAEACAGTAMPRQVATSATAVTLSDSRTAFDMRAVADGRLDELDWARVQLQIVAYCRKMQIDVPHTVTRAWLLERLEQLDLVRNTEGGPRPTNAGYLLFANTPEARISGSWCRIRIHAEGERSIQGNLWAQLEKLGELFATINRPFRLKGGISESVYPYPPLALKELLVNALVHRAYDVAEPVSIDLDSTFIRLVNPGGLVEPLFQRVKTRLQEQIELGNRGMKGYRNPVIADVFYGAGAMDKEGSGLPDVYSEVVRNDGRVFFGPIDDGNTAFRALIYRRQEEPDATTGTSPPAVSKSQYFANLLEVITFPERVWRAGTHCQNGLDVLSLAVDTPPPFALKRSTELLTFSDLSQPENPLARAVDRTTAEAVETSTLISTPEGHRNVVELLNRAFHRFLEARLLIVDLWKKRCYFPRTDTGPMEVTYQASVRQATRTVTKAIQSKRTGRILYWQHEALGFAFEQFGDAWGLRILPGYVFTTDGRHRFLHHLKIGALATRKAARDFNLQVYNDLVFWTWVLAQGKDMFHIPVGDDASIAMRGLLENCELSAPLGAELTVTPESSRDEDAFLARLEDEVAEATEAELEATSPAEGDDAD